MALLLPALPAETPDLFGIGLVLAIVGGFLLANSILFRHPRTLVEDFFGGTRQRLSSIREYIFHRVQVHLGFLFLLLGFGLQLFGHYRAPGASDVGRSFPVLWVGVIALAVVGLEVLGWWLSHALFRRYVRKHFEVAALDLEGDVELARELGELFGIRSEGDDSVQSYILRLRERLGMPPVRPGPAERAVHRVHEPGEELEIRS